MAATFETRTDMARRLAIGEVALRVRDPDRITR